MEISCKNIAKYIDVGTKVYVTDTSNKKVTSQTVYAIYINGEEDSSFFLTKYPSSKNSLLNNYVRKHRFKQIGKTVFLKKSDAEKAMGRNLREFYGKNSL